MASVPCPMVTNRADVTVLSSHRCSLLLVLRAHDLQRGPRAAGGPRGLAGPPAPTTTLPTQPRSTLCGPSSSGVAPFLPEAQPSSGLALPSAQPSPGDTWLPWGPLSPCPDDAALSSRVLSMPTAGPAPSCPPACRLCPTTHILLICQVSVRANVARFSLRDERGKRWFLGMLDRRWKSAEACLFSVRLEGSFTQGDQGEGGPQVSLRVKSGVWGPGWGS